MLVTISHAVKARMDQSDGPFEIQRLECRAAPFGRVAPVAGELVVEGDGQPLLFTDVLSWRRLSMG